MTFFLKQFKVWMVLLLIHFFILTISYILGDRQGLIIGFIISFFISYISLYQSPQSPLEYFKAQKNLGRDPWALLEMNDELCGKIKLMQPEIWLIPNEEPLILVVSPSMYKPAIAFSQGLLDRLKSNELEAVMTLALTTLKQKYKWYSQFFERCGLTFLTLLENLKKITPIFLYPFWNFLFSPLVCLFFKLSHTIGRQLEADSESKKYLQSTTVLAQTVWNIYGSLTHSSIKYPTEIQHYILIYPHAACRKFIRLHPSIEKRLKNLVGYFPI